MKKTLTLRAERLAELTSDELRGVAGGDVSKLACVSAPVNCQISDQIMSLCGCFTGYCSIDVC